MKRWKDKTFNAILDSLKSRFNLDEDKAAEKDVVENISRGVVIRGTNMWVLIFATMVASLGLNVNSAAVIIGAMLISPLMGPIMGIGLSIGTNDFELLKKSLRNFGYMVIVSVITSALYFLISPLSSAQSELLARTVPTTYDVMIAFFGGLAGIVAQTRKDRTTTVIPGVAIATALMPPLCTAGFGLATGNFNYFLGASYLFFINTVFIALATYIIVRYLKFSKKEFMDPARERKAHRYIIFTTIITIIPSVILGYRIILRSYFETNVDKYISEVYQFEKTQVIDYKQYYSSDSSAVEIILIGDPISNDVVENLKAQATNYGIRRRTAILIHQSSTNDTGLDLTSLQSSYSEILTEKNRRITELQQAVEQNYKDALPASEYAKELIALTPQIYELKVEKTNSFNAQGVPTDTTVICVATGDLEYLSQIENIERIRNWLMAKTGISNIDIYIDNDQL
ncbi:MAG: DUF389 domain-containing protein [Rikenellaceae bacterium]